MEPGELEPHDFASKKGDREWCHWCDEHRNHPVHTANRAEIVRADVAKKLGTDAATVDAIAWLLGMKP